MWISAKEFQSVCVLIFWSEKKKQQQTFIVIVFVVVVLNVMWCVRSAEQTGDWISVLDRFKLFTHDQYNKGPHVF